MAATTKAATRPKETEAPPREAMSLQEKFVKLREAVPSITQKQHSDGVKYKFAKIFDVYELLTPSMNEFGVNFDIVAEQATRHAENGDPMYYSSFVQHARSGDRVVWVYEADLTLRWTNADDPEDTLEVTLHAIGTNDGGPDKAKGSAWTYCLKYYLFEKFGIDQGDDDPDMNDHGSEAPAPSNRGTTPQNAADGTKIQQQQKKAQNGHTGASLPLSEAQLSRMYRKGDDAGLTKEKIDSWILKKYEQQDPSKLTRAQYDETCAALDKQKAAQVKQKQDQGGTANA
ncbi:ERF family protein [Eisenbergiella sp.]